MCLARGVLNVEVDEPLRRAITLWARDAGAVGNDAKDARCPPEARSPLDLPPAALASFPTAAVIKGVRGVLSRHFGAEFASVDDGGAEGTAQAAATAMILPGRCLLTSDGGGDGGGGVRGVGSGALVQAPPPPPGCEGRGKAVRAFVVVVAGKRAGPFLRLGGARSLLSKPNDDHDPLAVDAATGGEASEEMVRSKELALEAPSWNQEASPLLHHRVQRIFVSLDRVGVNEGTHMVVLVQGVANANLLVRLRQLIANLVVDAAVDDQAARGGAALTARSYGAKHRCRDDHLQVCIAGDDDGVVSTQLEQGTSEASGHSLCDNLSHPNGSGG